jgi:hypothetical protein
MTEDTTRSDVSEAAAQIAIETSVAKGVEIDIGETIATVGGEVCDRLVFLWPIHIGAAVEVI